MTTQAHLTEEQEKLVNEFMKDCDKRDIVRAARRDGEFAFGPVLTWLRDYFNVPKSQGYPVAEEIIRRYGLDPYVLDMPDSVRKKITGAVLSKSRPCGNAHYHRIIGTLDMIGILNRYSEYEEKRVRMLVNDFMYENCITEMCSSMLTSTDGKTWNVVK